MEKMTKVERVKAALNKEEVDRLPMSVWLHYPHLDQDPRSLAEHQVAVQKEYDFDFIKLMPFGLYTTQDFGAKIKFFCQPNDPAIIDEFGIKDISDWGKIEPLGGTYGTYGKQVQLAQHVYNLVGDDVPFIQTIFSPLTTARKLGGDRIFEDLKKDPKLFHQALKALTETSVNFIKANIEAGVSGFFFATQCSATDLMTPEDHAEFGEKYDLMLFDAFKDDTFFNVCHMHGENVMFDTLANYPANCLNWHDRWVPPSLGEARKLTDKCLLGGINENGVLAKASPAEVQAHVAEAVADASRTGLMIGPGCVAAPLTPEINYYAARMAVENK
ncbi:uroporphyrinogen decarboxylase family protein [Dethiosulfatarculus sandiegensis]|nr:uroporphyrinogen decarboxylase family protein [Dethiosulfatarculus sandiegensis]